MRLRRPELYETGCRELEPDHLYVIREERLPQRVTVGKGCVIVLGTVPSENDMKNLIALACAQGGVAVPQVTGEVMAVRRSGEAGEGVMLIEYGAKEASYALDAPMVDLLTGERLAGTIALHPYDVKVLKKA